MHDLQLFDITFMEIFGGPFPLHPPPFSGGTKLQVQQADHFFGVPHEFLGAPSACTLHGMHPGWTVSKMYYGSKGTSNHQTIALLMRFAGLPLISRDAEHENHACQHQQFQNHFTF